MFNRDLRATTPHGLGSFNVYHPAMQETLLNIAEKAGAEVRRGIGVDRVAPESPAKIQFEDHGETVFREARVVVGADGRNSQVRSWAGFQVNRDPDRLMIAGILFEGMSAPEDATHLGVGEEGATLVAGWAERGPESTLCIARRMASAA